MRWFETMSFMQRQLNKTASHSTCVHRHAYASLHAVWHHHLYRCIKHPQWLAVRPSWVAGASGSKMPAHTTWLRHGGADGPASPFAELRLLEGDLANAGGAIHGRRYDGLNANDTDVPDLSKMFQDPSRPLVVDVGCGAGRFVLLAAVRGVVPDAGIDGQQQRLSVFSAEPANFLGIDQHATLIARGNVWASERGVSQTCKYLALNARTSLHSLLATYPGPVALLAVQYPDPHYRRQRHVITPEFVRSAAAAVAPGGLMFLASDVLSTAAYMRDMFATHAPNSFALHHVHHDSDNVFKQDEQEDIDPYLPVQVLSDVDSTQVKHPVSPRYMQCAELQQEEAQLSKAWADSDWLKCNPFGVPTEREVFANLVTKFPVFRVLLRRHETFSVPV